ncbi:MAG: Ig-like domain-containing protein, partial [Geobacteraceae bacterium]|nr:Ig-like domain-containing protein [Geobacteraceae bacterium]
MNRFAFIILTAFALVIFASSQVTLAASATWVTPPTSGAVGVSENIQPSVTIPAAINPDTVFNGTNYSFILKTGSSCSGGTLVPSTVTRYADTPTTGTTTVTLTPSATLVSSATYCACINSGTSLTMKDIGGTNVSPASRYFTVRDYLPPTVTAITPTPDHTTVNTGSPTISFTFSELMNTATINSSTFTLNDGANDIPGTFSYTTLSSPSRTKVTFTPSSLPLATMTTFYATVKGTVQDTSGNQMGADFLFDFSVDTTAPVVSSYSPFPGSSGVAYTNVSIPSIKIVFGEDMKASTLTTSNIYIWKYGTSTNLAATVSYDPATRTVTLTPSSALLSDTVYTVTVKGPSGVQDYWGNYMAANFSWNFTEDYTAPVVASVSPVNGATNVSVTSPITITFTEATGMNASTIGSGSVTLSDGTNTVLGSISYDAGAKKITLTVPSGLAFGTTYTVTLTSDIKDMAGNSLSSAPYTWSFTTQPVVNSYYSIIPPFITAPVTPNVLIILDNSNSMDEDMQGNAVGSPRCTVTGDPNTCSRSILARKALIDLVTTYANKMRIGLMTYKLSSADKRYLHNSFYFSSYDPKSYCPNPPTECYNYCVNENPQTGVYTPSADESACSASCSAQNALFDVTYRDKILTSAGTSGSNGTAVGSDKRKNYCSILYPKTMRHVDGSGTTLYHGLAGTYYATSNQGTRYLYSSAYNSTEYPGQTDTYTIYTTKTGTSDGNSGYGGSTGSGGFVPTDDDIALGFSDFGQRMYWDYSSRTWFSNSSPGSGYLHVAATDNVPPGNAQLNALLAKLGTAGFE